MCIIKRLASTHYSCSTSVNSLTSTVSVGFQVWFRLSGSVLVKLFQSTRPSTRIFIVINSVYYLRDLFSPSCAQTASTKIFWTCLTISTPPFRTRQRFVAPYPVILSPYFPISTAIPRNITLARIISTKFPGQSYMIYFWLSPLRFYWIQLAQSMIKKLLMLLAAKLWYARHFRSHSSFMKTFHKHSCSVSSRKCSKTILWTNTSNLYIAYSHG